MIDLSIYPVDEHGNRIVPDEVFDQNYNELPDGTKNQSMTARAYHGGKLSILGSNPEKDRAIQSAGGKALSAVKAQRRTICQAVDYLLAQKIPPEHLQQAVSEQLRQFLPEDCSLVDLLGLSMLQEAMKGNAKAAEYIRDSVGERPKDELKINAEQTISDADRALLEKVNARYEAQKNGRLPE